MSTSSYGSTNVQRNTCSSVRTSGACSPKCQSKQPYDAFGKLSDNRRTGKVGGNKTPPRAHRSEQELGDARFDRAGHIRRFCGVAMDEISVMEILLEAGYSCTRAKHKEGTKQSHGRWEIQGDFFEIHLGYQDKKSPPAPLTDTIIQGMKGNTASRLDQVAWALQRGWYARRQDPSRGKTCNEGAAVLGALDIVQVPVGATSAHSQVLPASRP